jgi:NAD(P)-dependent dehydrogenase (short-subunit alcohol dehydrogenase family)
MEGTQRRGHSNSALERHDRTGSRHLFADTAARLPVGRVGGPEDIAETYLYPMQAEFTTGQILVIDEGAVIS